MVLTDSHSDSKSTQSSMGSPDVVNVNAQPASLPQYPGYTTVVVPIDPRSPLLPAPAYQIQHQRRPGVCRRVFRGIIAVLLLLFVVRSAVRWGSSFFNLPLGPPSGPLASDGQIVECFDDVSSTWEQQSVKFSLPVDASKHFFLSRGGYGFGKIQYDQTSDPSVKDVEVEVTMSYYDPAILDHIKVCHLKRSGGQEGVGFFSPRYTAPSNPHNRVTFHVVVRFPSSSSDDGLLRITALESDLPIWSQEMASLKDSILFKSLTLASSNTPIDIESTSAISASIRTSNSRISGAFNVTDRLILSTSNAPIKVDAWLDNRKAGQPTHLDARTSNARVDGSFTLVSGLGDKQASFDITTRSSNAPLKLEIADAPSSPFSNLKLGGHTSNSPVELELHPTYEGSIDLRSSIYRPTIHADDPRDPSGEGRSRSITYRRMTGTSAIADVKWGDEASAKGQVNLGTSNGRITVRM